MSIKNPAQATTCIQKNGRLGSTKTKTGCLTCKARKVKCDELKPRCQRCINAGRKCQGYDDIFVSVRLAEIRRSSEQLNVMLSKFFVLAPSRSSSPPMLISEARALRYYQTNIANILGGSMDSDFWTRSVLQLSEAEPPVRQALVAMSSVFEMQTRYDLLDLNEAQRRSTETYNKALASTAQRVGEPKAETVALATCALFLCLHFLQGDRDKAVNLLRSGSGVMQRVLLSLQDPALFEVDPIAAMFLPLFERLLVLIRMFGEFLPHIREPSWASDGSLEENLSHLRSFEDAQTTLFWLVAETHDLVVKSRRYRHHPNLEGAEEELDFQVCLQRQGVQLAAYTAWAEGFDRLCISGWAYDPRRVASLRLSHTVTVIWLSTCLDKEEDGHEKYNPKFAAAVHEAEKVLKQGSPPFTFEMGVIPPLYLTTIKCRDSGIRMRAFELLQMAPAREGLWNREETVRVAKRIIELETTEGLVVGRGIMFKDARICEARTKYTDRKGTHVTFFSKRKGCSDLHLIWDEHIPLCYSPSSRNGSSEQGLFTQRGVN